MTLELDQIQSEIVRGYQRGPNDPIPDRLVYLLLKLPTEHAELRDVLAAIEPHVTSAAKWTPACSVNVGFTHRVFTRLGYDCLEFGDAFHHGMHARAPLLGDGSADGWQFSDAAVDAIVMIQGSAIDATEKTLRALLAGHIVRELAAVRLKENRENFNFVDGISQPAYEGLAGSARGYGAATATGWRFIKPGELVLGYEDEAGPYDGAAELRNGTFMALRKLEQHVGAFAKYVDDQATARGCDVEFVRARIVGRKSDGDPLVATRGERNDFGFAGDPDGFACPHGAHIRRANPRDALDRVGDRAERHRMARRALMYATNGDGKLAVEPGEDPAGFGKNGDGIERGMIFAAFNASLERQFEFVQSSWLSSGGSAPARLYTSSDPLTGANGSGSYYVIPGVTTHVLDNLQPFVTTRGGGYFFLPSLALLARMAALPVPGPSPPPTPEPAPLGDRLPKIARSVFDVWRAAGKRVFPWPILRRREKEQRQPEQQLVLAMAPLIASSREHVRKLLRDDAGYRRGLDHVMTQLEDDKRRRLVHHARIVVVPELKAWLSHDSHTPTRLPLPDDDWYLLFACWFDGERRALFDKLAHAIAQPGAEFPFVHCHRFPPRDELDGRALDRFFWDHAIATSFLYRGYSATAAEVQRALQLHTRFIAEVDALDRQKDSQTWRDGFGKFLDELG